MQDQDKVKEMDRLLLRDKLRMRLSHPLLKETKIDKECIGMIFVVTKGNDKAQIMSRETFLDLPIEEIVCWEKIGEFDVNSED